MGWKLISLALLVLCASGVAWAQNPQQQRPPANRPAAAPPPPPAPAPAAPAATTPRFWYTTVSNEGGYTVDLPGKPTERRLDLNDAKGKPVISYLQEVNLDGGKTYFGMVWTRIETPKDAQAAEKKLNEARDGTRAALKGTLITTRPLRFGNFQGLEYVIEAGATATRFRYRAFILGDRFVQQVYSGTTGSENSPEVRKFHDSLKLKP